jgi:hypothetical protein
VLDALYERRAPGVFVPSRLTQGPWSPDAQHGGPVAALLAGLIESVPTDQPMQVVRLTVELLRPVPLRPLSASVTVTRPGKRVQLLDAHLVADDAEVAAARALRIRVAKLDVPDDPAGEPIPPPVVGVVPPPGNVTVPYAEAVELRFLDGGWDVPGPVRMWSRLLIPVVGGEQPSPLQRTAAAADFGNGVSSVLDFTTHVFINPDLTVSLSRVPAGEWVGFDVVTRLSPEGFGLAESAIFDVTGTVGRATQSLFVDGR